MYDYRTDPVVTETASAVRALYGARLKGLYLFGSRARGDVNAESDYDYLVLLEQPFDWWSERKSLSRLALEIEERTGSDVFFLPDVPEGLAARTAFMGNVRRDAVAL